jgi:hypothetical protein
MTRSLGYTAASRLLIAAALAASVARSAPASEAELVIRVYDGTKASTENLAVAGAEAIRILSRAGLNATWLNCSASRLEHPTQPACHRPRGPAELILKIVSRAPDAQPGISEDAFGLSVLPESGVGGVFAVVFRDSVDRLFRASEMWRFRVVGLLAAHEIGHLLLGSNSHSGAGIMRPDLYGETLESAAWGNLVFAPSEAERMRAALRHRMDPAAHSIGPAPR